MAHPEWFVRQFPKHRLYSAIKHRRAMQQRSPVIWPAEMYLTELMWLGDEMAGVWEQAADGTMQKAVLTGSLTALNDILKARWN